MPTEQTRPAVADLRRYYGSPSQAGFGSAVFDEPLADTAPLADLALATYRHFVGDRWARFGEAAWLGPWRAVLRRADGARGAIIAELRGIGDADAARVVPLLWEGVERPDEARAALTAVYDDPAITELLVFNLGDGAALAGLLIAGRWATGRATLLVLLMD